MSKQDSGRVPSAPGSHPSGHAGCAVDGAPRFDPSRMAKAISLTEEDEDWLILVMLGELHAHIPEDQRPMSMSDLSEAQTERARKAVQAVKRIVVTGISEAFRAFARDSDGSGEAIETAKTGSTEGDSAGREAASPEHSSPSGSDLNEGLVERFIAEQLTYAETIRVRSNQHANGIIETCHKLAALRSTPSSTLTPPCVETKDEWRCINCKHVVSSATEPERCGQCQGRAFAHIVPLKPATPAILDQALEEAAAKARSEIMSMTDLGQYRHPIANQVEQAIRALKSTGGESL